MRKPRYNNSFAPLNNLIQYYKYQTFGHRAIACKLKNKRLDLVIEKTIQLPKV